MAGGSRIVARASIASVLAAMLACSSADADDPAIPPAIFNTVETRFPGARPLERDEIDGTSCAPLGASPSILRGRFSGQAHEDFALLLKLRETGETISFEGKTLRQAEIAFVIFLRNGKGGFDLNVVADYENYLPTASQIRIVPPGVVRNLETQDIVEFSNPAIVLSFCEKSSSLYYFDQGEIHVVPLAD